MPLSEMKRVEAAIRARVRCHRRFEARLAATARAAERACGRAERRAAIVERGRGCCHAIAVGERERVEAEGKPRSPRLGELSGARSPTSAWTRPRSAAVCFTRAGLEARSRCELLGLMRAAP